jgi:hypothetical protein
MPMLSIVEAAIKLGVGVPLIEYFIDHCPKHKEDRKLPSKSMEGHILRRGAGGELPVRGLSIGP